MNKRIDGFSKLSKEEKIAWITQTHFENPNEARQLLEAYWNKDTALQLRHDEFIENTLSNFYLPLGVAPNFLIDEKMYTIPMVIEESSVVAAAGNAAKFWGMRGGFKGTVISTQKTGQIHFFFQGNVEKLKLFFEANKNALLEATDPLAKSMRKRGGGISFIELKDKRTSLENYFQLHVGFETADAMGANFINSCLEKIAATFKDVALQYSEFSSEEKAIEVVMSILSNYTPDCLVKASVSCPVSELGEHEGMPPEVFAGKFVQAIAIAEKEPCRAVTHNKGIMNGIDAVAIATGNDFRALEAGIHAYAARDGQYRSLSKASVEDDIFTFELTIPLSLGTVGGLTQLHPLVKWSLELLGNPCASTLMRIVAVAGLAQNFAAVRSLVTSGIQKGHMKMHLLNMLNQLKATKNQKVLALEYFKTHLVSAKAVQDFLTSNP